MFRKRILYLLVIKFSFCSISCDHKTLKSKQIQVNKFADSIDFYLDKSKQKSLSKKNKRQSLFKAYTFSQNLQDTLKNDYLAKIADLAYSRDTVLFKKINRERLRLSVKLKDSLGIGDSYYLYGTYYYYRKENLDSAYISFQKANRVFKEINHDIMSGRVLYVMACIKKDVKDFTSSEKLAYQAIKKFNNTGKDSWFYLYFCYNLIGNNFNSLEEFDKSLLYHHKAINCLDKFEGGQTYMRTSLNNIGRLYESMGEHTKAVEYFQKALKDETLKDSNVKSYARLLDNLAYNKFKSGDTIGVHKTLNKALKMRGSINFVSGIVLNKIHLSEFYLSRRDRKDTLQAIKFLKDAKILAESVDNNRDHLVSLKMLSKLDKLNATKYLDSYITLSDSLQKQERSIRNKFTRIEYETDEYIEETKRLTTQNILISVIAAIVVIVLGLLYFIRRQRAKNKELLFEQEQQRANQEIYDLMQKRQTNLREGRQEERHRISEELHDGILGKLFGTRVGMGYLSLTGDQEDVKEYKSYLDELQGIEKEIRDISHALKNNILKSDNSFVAVIEDYLSNQSKVHGFNYSNKSKKDINWAEIDDKLKVTLYRIVQEAIQNVVKHAGANNVTLVFSKTEKQLHLNVTDDGKGFNSTQGKKGIGLKNMEARILKHYGTLHLDSKEGEGTSITISVAI